MSTKYTLATIALSILCFFSVGQVTPVEASSTDNIFGYAWSGNVGWISFNNCVSFTSCTGANYGVTMNAGGVLSGYAWSDNIGWISFNETTGCPAGTTTPTVHPSSGALGGCAKVVAATGGSNGWDGWISLSGVTLGVADSSGVRSMSGYAWGSSVVGWIDMSGVQNGVPLDSSVLLTANPTLVTAGPTASATLTWVVQGMNSCTATNSDSRTDWTGSKSATGGIATVNVVGAPTAGITYTLTCTVGNVTKNSSVLVKVDYSLGSRLNVSFQKGYVDQASAGQGQASFSDGLAQNIPGRDNIKLTGSPATIPTTSGLYVSFSSNEPPLAAASADYKLYYCTNNTVLTSCGSLPKGADGRYNIGSYGFRSIPYNGGSWYEVAVVTNTLVNLTNNPSDCRGPNRGCVINVTLETGASANIPAGTGTLYFIPILNNVDTGNCTDGIQNGDETGVDTGGRCTPGTKKKPIYIER